MNNELNKLWVDVMSTTLLKIFEQIEAPYFPIGSGRFNYTLENFNDFYSISEILADTASQSVYINLIALYIASGFFSTAEQQEVFALINKTTWKQLEKQAEEIKNPYIRKDYIADRIDTWILEGYAYGDICRASSGDIVIDGGAYTGNTSFYFASLVGMGGRVYAFEPSKEIFNELEESVHLSNQKNIIPTNYALSDFDGVSYFSVLQKASASRLSNEQTPYKVPVISLDNFFINHNVEKIDFIKLDVEDNEAKVIIGAKNIIQKFCPKMAISIYHRVEDPITIPQLILSINPNYKFYIKHNSNRFNETVLFCVPTQSPCVYKKTQASADITSYISIFKQLYHKSRSLYYDYMLNRIASEFKHIVSLPFKMDYKKNNYYLYFPFSPNPFFHYEILISNKNVCVCIHFEKIKQHTQELYSQVYSFFTDLKKQFPLAKIDENNRLGFHLDLLNRHDDTTISAAAYALKEIVETSLPKFDELNLLTPELREHIHKFN